ncbi:MAG: CDP-alcohol phosphatidyltransferase family protein [Lachnospiraceae bacterium]|nr:CDP-alcohol phosphatidyltransferase family protein [Lachnospiraceae bacterium]
MNKYDGNFVTVTFSDSLTVPNFLSLFRIILIIPFVLLFSSGKIFSALTVLIISGITDCLDGFIARKFNQVSQLGKYLDPLADKLTLIAVCICLSMKYRYFLPILCILAVKEIVVLIGAVYLLCHCVNPPQAKWFGKAATVSFYLSALSVLLLYILNIRSAVLVIVPFAVTVSLTIVALLGYYRIFKKLLTNPSKSA